jgi:hypothetical protein
MNLKNVWNFKLAVSVPSSVRRRETDLKIPAGCPSYSLSREAPSMLRFVEQLFQVLLPDGGPGVGSVAMGLL